MEEIVKAFGGFQVLGSVLLALVGYAFTHWLQLQAQLNQQRLEARFDFVSAQLERLYGPLYALVEANTAAWKTFRETFRPGQSIEYSELTYEEKVVWKKWAENVFIPSNLRIREVIETHAHLLVEGELPEILLKLIAHIESSKLVIPLMDNEENMKTIDDFEPWPRDLQSYVRRQYRFVAGEHAELSGRVQNRPHLHRRASK